MCFGIPNSRIITSPEVLERALRESRSCHESRECARCARERGTFVVVAKQREATETPQCAGAVQVACKHVDGLFVLPRCDA